MSQGAEPSFEAALERVVERSVPELARAPYESYLVLDGQRIVLEELKKLAEELGGSLDAKTIDLFLQAIRRALTAVASKMMEKMEVEG